MTPPSEYPQAGRSDISQESVDQSTFDKHQQRWLSDLKARGAKIVQVTYPRTANNDKELTVVRGEYLEVSWDLSLGVLLVSVISFNNSTKRYKSYSIY